jgi:hypothetical protein
MAECPPDEQVAHPTTLLRAWIRLHLPTFQPSTAENIFSKQTEVQWFVLEMMQPPRCVTVFSGLQERRHSAVATFLMQ